MGQHIFNDAVSKGHNSCVFCECPKDTHLVFWPCPLLEGNLICQEDCQVSFLKDDIATQVSQKLGHEVTKEFINETCRKCGMNNACQNQKLAEVLESDGR